MGSFRLRQGPAQLRHAGRFSWRSSLFGLILGLALLVAAPSAWAGVGISGGVLVYTARVGDQNQITVTGSGSDYIVTDAVPIDATNPPGGCTVSGNMATC